MSAKSSIALRMKMTSQTNSVCSISSFPFTYFDETRSPVSGNLTSDGTCIFPTANCGSLTVVHECCQKNTASLDMTTGGNYMYIAFAVIFLPLIYFKYWSKTAEEREASRSWQRERMIPTWVDEIPLRSVQRVFPHGKWCVFERF